MSARLQGYLIAAAREGFTGKRGRHPVSNIHRDEAIFHAVQIAIGGGLSATRNREPGRHGKREQSACAVVAGALEKLKLAMSESEVETIWSRRKKLRASAGFSS